MSDGTLIEARLSAGRVRTVCVMTGVEAKILARRYGTRTMAEALRLEEERQSEETRRAFVRALWRNRERGY